MRVSTGFRAYDHTSNMLLVQSMLTLPTKVGKDEIAMCLLMAS